MTTNLNLIRPNVAPLRSSNSKIGKQNKQSFSVADLKGGQSIEFSLAGVNKEAPKGIKNKQESTQIDSRGRYLGRKTEKNINPQIEQASELEEISTLKKIHKAATDYEEVLIKQMIESMPLNPIGDAPGGSGFVDMAREAFAGFLAQAGGLGLAEKITTQVARQEGLEESLAKNPQILGAGAKIKIPGNFLKKTVFINTKSETDMNTNIPHWDEQSLMDIIFEK